MSDSTFNILSFDGGGIRGALSIKLLEKIQNEPGPQDAREINIDFKLSAESGSPEISGFRPESGPHRKTQVLN